MSEDVASSPGWPPWHTEAPWPSLQEVTNLCRDQKLGELSRLRQGIQKLASSGMTFWESQANWMNHMRWYCHALSVLDLEAEIFQPWDDISPNGFSASLIAVGFPTLGLAKVGFQKYEACSRVFTLKNSSFSSEDSQQQEVATLVSFPTSFVFPPSASNREWTSFCESNAWEGWGAHGEQLTLLAFRMPTGLKEKTPASKKASHVSEDDFLFFRFMELWWAASYPHATR